MSESRLPISQFRRLKTRWPCVEDAGALTDADAATISESTTAGAGSPRYRVKLCDKKSALDAIARHLGMFVPAGRRQEGQIPEDLAENARDVLARRLARLAAGGSEE
jgi:hypothetical protein